MSVTADTGLLPLAFGQTYRLGRAARADGTFAETIRPCPVALEFLGGFDVGLMSRCVAETARAHQALRVHYEVADGVVHQRISDHMEVPVVVHGRVDGGEQAVFALIRRSALQPFDLGAGPLLRCGYAEVEAGRGLFWTIFDHSVVDNVAVEVYVRALVARYAGALGPTALKPPEPALSYADWVRWAASAPWEVDEPFWRDRMAEGNPYTFWDTLLSADNGTPQPAASVSLEWDAEEMSRLRSRGLPAGFEQTAGILAAFSRALAAEYETAPVVVHVPSANRGHRESRNVIANMATEVPLRMDISGTAPLADLVPRVRSTLIEALRHQAVPISRLMELAGGAARRADDNLAGVSGGDSPRMQLNILRRGGEDLVDVAGVRIRTVRLPADAAEVGWVSGLVLNVEIGPEAMQWTATYCPDHLGHDRASRILRRSGEGLLELAARS